MLLKLKKIKNKILIIVFLFLSLFFLFSNKLDEEKTWKSIVKEYFNFSKQNSLTLLKKNNSDTRNKFFKSIDGKRKIRKYEKELSKNPYNKKNQNEFNKLEWLIKTNLKYKNFKDKFVSFFDARNNFEVFEFQYIHNFNKSGIYQNFKEEINNLIHILDLSWYNVYNKNTFGERAKYMKEKFKSFLNKTFIDNLKLLKWQKNYNEILNQLQKKNITLTYSILFEEKNGKKNPILLKNFYFNDYKEEELVVFEHNIHFGVYKVLDKLKLSWMFGNVFTQHLFNQWNITPTKREQFLKYIKYFERVFDEFETQYKDRLDYYNKEKKKIINDYWKKKILFSKRITILKRLKTFKNKNLLIKEINKIIKEVKNSLKKINNPRIKELQRKIKNAKDKFKQLYKKLNRSTFFNKWSEHKNKIKPWEDKKKLLIRQEKQKQKLFKDLITWLKKLIEKIENKEQKILDFLSQNNKTWLSVNNFKSSRWRKSESLIYDRNGREWKEKLVKVFKKDITFSYNGFKFLVEKDITYFQTESYNFKTKTYKWKKLKTTFKLLSISYNVNGKKIELKNINIRKVFFKNIDGKKHFKIILTHEFIDNYLWDSIIQPLEDKKQSSEEQKKDKYQKIKIKLQNMIFEYQNILEKDKLNKKKDLDRLLEIFDHVYQDLYFALKKLKQKFKEFKDNKIKIFLNYLQHKNGWSLYNINNHENNTKNFQFYKNQSSNYLMVYLKGMTITLLKYKVIDLNGYQYILDISKQLPKNILYILKKKITSKNGKTLSSISLLGFKLSNDGLNLMIELENFHLTKTKVNGFSIVENILVDHSKPLPIELITIIIRKYIKNKNVVILSYINEQSIFVFSKDSKNKNFQVKLKNYDNTLKTIENYKVIKIQDNEYIINVDQKLTDNILKLIKSILISLNGSVFNETINKLNNFKFYQGDKDKLKVNLTFQGTNHKVHILYYKVIEINSKKYIVNTEKTIFGQLLKDIKNKLKELLTTKKTLTLIFLNTQKKLAFDSQDGRLTVKLKNEENQTPIKIIGYKVNNGTIKQINVNNKETLKEEGELLLNEKQKGLGQNSLKIDDLNKNDINLKFQATDGYLSLEHNKIKIEIDKSKYKVICGDILVKIDEKLDGAALKKLNELLEENHGKVFSKITLNDFILKNEESQIKVKLKIQTDDRFFVKIDDYVVYKSFLKNKNKRLPENIKEKSNNNGEKNNKLIIILVSSLFGAPVVIFILFKIFQLF